MSNETSSFPDPDETKRIALALLDVNDEFGMGRVPFGLAMLQLGLKEIIAGGGNHDLARRAFDIALRNAPERRPA